MNILSRFKLIKTFIFDMDGVLTDGSLMVEPNGNWIRRMNIKDGYAIQLAVKTGYKVAVISGSESTPVLERLRKLGVNDVFMNVHEKENFLKEYMLNNKILNEETLFMGDDIPDYGPLKIVGLPCCPADAVAEIKQICSYISPVRGGYGCGRDVIEKVLKLNDQWPLNTIVAAI